MTQPVVVITGVAGGIGFATASLFYSKGWTVVGLDKVAVQPSNTHFYQQIDLACIDPVLEFTANLAIWVTRIDCLVNNAAMQVCKPLIKTNVTEWDAIMAVNVRAPFLLARETYPLLSKAQGNIVNISSVHSLATSANIAAYAASKGALTALTRAQAIEFAPNGIRVNAVLPGAVDTPMLASGLTRGHLGDKTNIENLKNLLAAKTVSGKVGKPEDIAELIYFLADNNRAGFITGQAFVADGGAICRLSTE